MSWLRRISDKAPGQKPGQKLGLKGNFVNEGLVDVN